MRPLDVFLMAFEATKTRRLRTALTVLGVVIGIATIVVLLSLTRGLQVSVTAQLTKTGTNTLSVSSGSSRFGITSDTVNAISRLDGVRRVVPYVRGTGNLTSSQSGECLQVVAIAIEHDALGELFPELELEAGSLVNDYDLVGVVVGSNVANPPDASKPFTEVNKIVTFQVVRLGAGGTIVKVRRSLLVRGVLAPYGLSMFFPVDDAIFVAPSVAQALGRRYGSYDGLIVITNTIDDVAPVTDAIRGLYGNDARIFSPQQLTQMVQQALGTIQLFLTSIAATSLLVAGVGITNIMHISVMERTRIIGLLKALGASSRTIVALFLAEALLIGIIGGGLGLATGAVMASAVSQVLFGEFGSHLGGALAPGGKAGRPAGLMPPEVSRGMASVFRLEPMFEPTFMTLAFGFAVLISVAAGLYPAWKASRLDPVVSLRQE